MIEIEKVFETHVTGADILMETLIEEGVTTVFGIPGGAISPVYDLFQGSDMTHYLMRHEQAAAHAADGYYRTCGKIAVVVATSGPGALNLTTGLATAHKDRSALLAITGQTPLSKLGTDSFQEVRTTAVFRPIVKSTAVMTTPVLVKYMVKKMIKISMSIPPGPVHLDFPRDVQTGTTSWLPSFDWDSLTSAVSMCAEDIQSAARILVQSSLPVVLIGGGVVRSGMCHHVFDLCHLLNCPVVCTLMGKSGFPEQDPLFCGMVGSNGSKYANDVVQQADFVLALGTRLTDRTVWTTAFAPRADIVCINGEERIGSSLDNVYMLKGDLREVVPFLLKVLKNCSPVENRWKEIVSPPTEVEVDGSLLHPVAVLKALRALFPPDSIFVADTGQHQLFAANYLPVSRFGTFITSGGMGCMGFGFPASLGVKIARPDRSVVSIVGDGSFLMVCQELATAVKNDLPVTVCIFNNGYLGMIRQSQLSCFNRISQVDLSPLPDFVQLAESFGAVGMRIKRLDELSDIDPFPQKPTVLDISVDPKVSVPSHSYSWIKR